MASMTDYSKWAAYDAEVDINEVDVEEQREDRERQRRKARRDLQDFENKVVALALDVAGAAASRAKVERLRAMKNKRRGGRNRKPSSSSVVSEETSESKSPSNEELEKEIQRGENLQAAAVARTKGIKLLDGKQTCKNLMVQQIFQEAATAAESLLKNLPTLPASVRFIPVPQKKTSCGCGEGHDQPEQCVSAEEEKMKASGAEGSGEGASTRRSSLTDNNAKPMSPTVSRSRYVLSSAIVLKSALQ